MCVVGLAPLPAPGAAAPMYHREYNDLFRLDPVIDSEGEAVCQGASNASMHDGVLGRLLGYGQKRALNLVEEFRSQSRLLLLVPPCRFAYVFSASGRSLTGRLTVGYE